VTRQVQLADDLGPQQRDDVAEDREPEARVDLLGDGRAAEHVALLEDERPEAAAGEVGGADQAGVASADPDGVVALRQPQPPARATSWPALCLGRLDSSGPGAPPPGDPAPRA